MTATEEDGAKGQKILPRAQNDKVKGARGAIHPSRLSWESRRCWPLGGGSRKGK